MGCPDFRRRSVIGVLAALAAAVLGLVFLPLSASAGDSIRLRPFSLEAEQSSFLIGQPVYLRIGSKDAAPPSLEQGTLALSIQGPDGEEADYHPPLRYRSAPNASSGARVRFARVIAGDGGLVFRKPGRYRLRLAAPPSGPTGSFRPSLSDTLTLDFSLPVRAEDKRAFAILSRDPAEYALAVYLEGGQQLRTGMAIIRELEAFPNAYRRTAAFVLSSDWSQDYQDLATGVARPMDLRKALRFAQWDLRPGAYIPLRNAFRLQNAIEAGIRRDSTSSDLGPVGDSLAAFRARLSPVQTTWIRSF